MLYARYLYEAWLPLIDIRRILRKTGFWTFWTVHIASVSDCVLPPLTLLMLVLVLGVQIVCKWTGFLALRKNILPTSLLPRRWLDMTLFFEKFEAQPKSTLFQGYYIRICIFMVLLIWKYYVSRLSHLNYSEGPLFNFCCECTLVFLSPVFGTEYMRRKPPTLRICHSVHISVMSYFKFSNFNVLAHLDSHWFM